MRRFFTATAALVFLCAAIASYRYFLDLIPSEQKRFLQSEPFYAYPIRTGLSRVARLRSDPYGKGYFGASRNNNRTHQGLDLVSSVGDPVFASKSGRVNYSGQGQGYGLYIELRHPDGLRTRYAHLSRLYVEKGDWVYKGDKIGLSGKTGNADAKKMLPHLHFEIRNSSNPLNPTKGLLDSSTRLE